MREDITKRLSTQDLEITTQRGHGPGGQHQNKTDSAVRIVHKPTGLSVFINGKSQHQNKREALKIMAARVNELEQFKYEKDYSSDRKNQMKGGSRGGDKVRTYNFINQRVVDHRLKRKSGQIKKIMKGKFDLLLK